VAITVGPAASSNCGTGAGSSSPTLTMPNGINAGDMAVYFQTGNTGSQSFTFTGWTQQGSTLFNSTTLYTAVFTKIMDGTESGTSVGPTLGSSARWTCGVVILRGVDGITPSNSATTQRTATTTNSTLAFTSATPTYDDSIVVAYMGTKGFANGDKPSFTAGANYTEQCDNTSQGGSALNTAFWVGTRILSGGAGSGETPSSITSSTGTTRNNAHTIVFAPGTAPRYRNLHREAVQRAASR
jgi:hypothetical protein